MTEPDVAVSGEAPVDGRLVRDAVRHVLRGEGREAAISVTFLDAGSMTAMNREYKGHDRPTDVISFSLPQPDGAIAGDIYICPDVGAGEARERGEDPRRELLRLVVHGTLHVLGHDHPEDDGREESRMWRLQEHYLAGLP